MSKYGILNFGKAKLTKIEESTIADQRGHLVNFINENLPPEAERIKDATLVRRGDRGVSLLFTPKFAFENVTSKGITEFRGKIEECIGLITLDETTQASAVPHTPGKHLWVDDEQHRKDIANRMANLKKFLQC